MLKRRRMGKNGTRKNRAATQRQISWKTSPLMGFHIFFRIWFHRGNAAVDQRIRLLQEPASPCLALSDQFTKVRWRQTNSEKFDCCVALMAKNAKKDVEQPYSSMERQCGHRGWRLDSLYLKETNFYGILSNHILIFWCFFVHIHSLYKFVFDQH
jgi:hypothetical protein